MNKETIFTVSKAVILILILLTVVFALRAPAADLNILPAEIKGDYVDSTGLPYFSEMDSYYNLRLTQNYIDHGFAGDTIVNGTEMDMHRMAPDGVNVSYQLGISYVTAFLHDLANKFGNYSVKEVAFWAGAIVASFAVIPAFIFARRLTNDYGAFAAALIIGLAPNYFAHTFPGFFDTDMFYYIFSIFFIFFFVESIRADNLVLKVIFALLSVISIGIFSTQWGGYIFYIGLMAIFTIVYIVACYIFNVGDSNINEYSSKLKWFIHQKDFRSIVLLVVITLVGVLLFAGLDVVTNLFSNLFSLFSLQSASSVEGGFPNVMISVAEMQAPTLLGAGMGSAFLANSNGVINGIGGISILFAGLIVLYVMVSRVWKLRSVNSPKKETRSNKGNRVSASAKLDNQHKLKLSLGDFKAFGDSDDLYKTKRITVLYTTLFLVWVIVTVSAVTMGSRFTTTIVLPFAFLTGIFIGYMMDYVKANLNNDKLLIAVIVIAALLAAYPLTQVALYYGLALLVVIVALGLVSVYVLKPKKSASSKSVPIKKYIAIAAIILALISPSVCGAYQTSNQVVPGTSDPMWNSMVWINENTANDTVITSWWDFGYVFEIAADRQVTFDGGSQSGERAFWLGQAMTTDNLELSAGIFRMLDTSGTKAGDLLANYTGDNGLSSKILIDILPKTSEDATKTLVETYHLTDDQASKVVECTHPENPRPVIFVASSDMLQKAGWWSYFGAWNFTSQNSTNYNYYVPSQQLTVEPGSSGKLQLVNQSGMQVNVVVNRGTENNSTTAYTEALSTYNNSQIYINATAYNPLNISNMIVIEDGYLVKNESLGLDDANYTLFLMGEGNTYTPILIDNKLNNSMFTQLYLLGGSNQNVFTMVHMENGVSLWKINFENTAAGGSTNSTLANSTANATANNTANNTTSR